MSMEDSVFAGFDDGISDNLGGSEQESIFNKYSGSGTQIPRREDDQICMNKPCENNHHYSNNSSNQSVAQQYGQYYDKVDNRNDSMYESSNDRLSTACKTISMIEHVEPSSLPSAAPSMYEQTSVHKPLITHIPTLCTTTNDERNVSRLNNKTTRAKPNLTFVATANNNTQNDKSCRNEQELHLEHQNRKETQKEFNKEDDDKSDDDGEFDKAFVNSAVHNRNCNNEIKLTEQRRPVELNLHEEQSGYTAELPTHATKEQSVTNSFAISNTSLHDEPLMPNSSSDSLVERRRAKQARRHGTHRHHREVNNTSVLHSNGNDNGDVNNNNNSSINNNDHISNSREVLESKNGTCNGKQFNKVTTTATCGEAQEELQNKNEEHKSRNDGNNISSISNIRSNNQNIYYSYLIGHHNYKNDDGDVSDEQSPQVQRQQQHYHNDTHSLSALDSNASLQVEKSVSSRNETSSVGNKFTKNTKYDNSSGDDDDDSTSSNSNSGSGHDHESENEHSDSASNDNSMDESGHTAAERKFIDEFGFVIDEETKVKNEQYLRAIDGRQVARREVKWANMAADWENTNTKMFAKLKERCRKGIPARFRGVAWQLLLHSWHQMNLPSNAGVYVALREKKLSDKEVDATIARDRARTFPNHVLFKDDDGVGQRFLCNVLHAYAASDPEVGYVQGMAFLVAALSTQMGEEECFWALHEMMYNRRYNMRELYKPGFPLLHQFFYQLKRLIRRLLPRLGERFEKLEVDPSFYASQWFLTLFVYHFSFRSLLRIWDIFFCEGWKIIFRTGIALMRWEEERLLSLPFDELLPALKNLQDGKNLKEVIRRAHQVKFKTSLLDRYALEYQRYVRTSHKEQGDVFKNTKYDYLEKIKDKLRPSWMN